MRYRRTNTGMRSGVTLIEVAVAIGILGLLASILLPAVQSSREAARRTQCATNLKQVITAYHEYEEVYGEFPGPIVDRESWSIRILPYLEQRKPEIGPDGQEHGGAEIVPVYRCPSDPMATGSRAAFAGMSYFPNHGHGNSKKDGIYFTAPYEAIRAADVSDGMSNTAALSERLVPPSVEDANNVGTDDDNFWRWRLIRKTANFIADFDAFADECQANSTPPQRAFVIADMYNHIQAPNRHSCTNGNRNNPESQEYMAVTATSLHPGGVNVAMADGAVRFVSDAIARPVWRALGTRNGAETAANDVF